MAKISEFEISRQDWCYFAISYRNFFVGYVECDGDEWTAHATRTGWQSTCLTKLMDKYIDGGKPSPTAFFNTGVLSSQALRNRFVQEFHESLQDLD